MLPRDTLYRHGIALAPDRNAPATIDPEDLPGDSISAFPHWVELLLEGHPRPAEAEIRDLPSLSGLIGMKLWHGRRITMDVVKKGAVTIDSIPSPTVLARLKSRFHTPTVQCHSSEYPPLSMRLPWVDVTIKDIEGRYHTICANVDTGNSGHLTLPPSCVEGFGLGLLAKCRVNAIGGKVNASCGDVDIVWRGSHRTVECIQREDVDRPIIGMKLLSGKRITIDFDYLPPTVGIGPIPGSALSNKKLLQSLKSLRQRRR